MAVAAKIGLWRVLTATVCLAGALAGCATDASRPAEQAPSARVPAPVLRIGYACCNLHYNGDRISDANFSQFPFIPAGSPVKVRHVDVAGAEIEVAGKTMFLVVEAGRSGATAQEWVDRLVIADDPRQRLERYPANVRNAIVAGQLTKGMTREQVVMAIGHPQADEAQGRAGSHTRYWWSSFVPYYVYWGKNGTVARVEGPAEALAKMVYKGK